MNVRTTTGELRDAWNEINTAFGFRRVADDSSLEWFAGREGDALEPALMLLSRTEPAALCPSKSIEVVKRRRPDDRWTLTFRLTDAEQQAVFGEFCAMLINKSVEGCDEVQALKLVQTEYRKWGRLLQRKPMSEEASRGLLGEVVYLESLIQDGMNPMTALEAWTGPLGSMRDFEFSDGWSEVKTVGASADTVTISSLEQLDNDDVGHLVVHHIDKAAPNQQGAVALVDKVESLRRLVSGNPAAANLLEDRLEAAGFSELSEAAQQPYKRSQTVIYQVDKSFPRLTRSAVDPAVTSAKYQLSLAGIESWML